MGSFGTDFTDTMALATYSDGAWSQVSYAPVAPLALHPAAHVLHYSSTCFEGLKAYRHADGSVHVFRLDRHVARMRESIRLLCLPELPTGMLEQAILTVVDAARSDIPLHPGALYLRPVVIGTEPSIGSAGTASTEACLFVLASPVGSYFGDGDSVLRILIDDEHMRSAPHFGMAKSGGNYASALGPIVRARQEHGADQVLFCPGGDVQEAGAANFFLLDGKRVVTRPNDAAILHGVTRDSLLHLARGLGYTIEERRITVDEVLDWSRQGEAALSGTAAVLTGIGTFIHRGVEHTVGGGVTGAATRQLRDALSGIHSGESPDELGWLTRV